MKKLTRALLILTTLGTWLSSPYVAAQAGQIARARLTTKDIEEMMTTLSNWGRWGKDDQMGTLNLITTEKRKRAAALVRDGESVSLARELTESQPGGSKPFEHKMTSTGLTSGAISAEVLASRGSC